LKSKGFSLLETIVFVVLAALVIPIFFLTTQPVMKDMLTPTAWIKARFVAERKMEELMAYTFNDPRLVPIEPAYTTPCYTDPGSSGYDCQIAINYIDCDNGSPITPTMRCFGYVGTALTIMPIPPMYTGTTKYKRVGVTVRDQRGLTYTAVSAVSERY
jgi:hypothetical protein